MEAYQKLVENARERRLIGSSAAVLQWDQETYLPPKGVAFRAEQLSYLSGRAHHLKTLPTIGGWLDQAENEVEPDSRESANLREWRFSYERATRLPQELFGLEVPDSAQGCLQDIHWAMGAIGYFPTYTLGNILVAQLFAAANQDSTVSRGIESGNYLPLREWMRREIHTHGCRYLPNDLIMRATGKAPDPTDYLVHLRSRYLN